MKQEFEYKAKSIKSVLENVHGLKNAVIVDDGATSSLVNILHFLKLETKLKVTKAYCGSCYDDYDEITFTLESIGDIGIEEFQKAIKIFQEHILTVEKPINITEQIIKEIESFIEQIPKGGKKIKIGCSNKGEEELLAIKDFPQYWYYKYVKYNTWEVFQYFKRKGITEDIIKDKNEAWSFASGKLLDEFELTSNGRLNIYLFVSDKK